MKEVTKDDIKRLFLCCDFEEKEIEDVLERTKGIEVEYKECEGNDLESYNEITCFDTKGEAIAIIFDYICTDEVNVIEIS
ncbi:hypothetical protein [Paraclostridium bifermentans]|uniref:hypothetical protein n=1 Tax=Paraclostridium bifermentans TaxID=1490 RepID=UPI00374F0DFD